MGTYAGHRRNADPHARVMRRHAGADAALRTSGHGNDVARIHRAAGAQWTRCLDLGAAHGWRNAQATLIAPTGTTGIVMDCDTAGVEPDFALVKTRKVVGGDPMRVVNTSVARALATLGYDDAQRGAILAYVRRHGRAAGAPVLREADLPVFDCATGERFIPPLGHLRMMAAIQPFLSGAISKTVNLPASATVDDIELVFRTGWSLGLKAVAVYRDGCKATQPVTSARSAP
jgi:ribonucleoside-diphosphate reductase alpha chain